MSGRVEGSGDEPEEEDLHPKKCEEIYDLEGQSVPTGEGCDARVIPFGQRAEILTTSHYDFGHWDSFSTSKPVKDRFWWLGVYRDVREHVKACAGFHPARRLPKYYTSIRAPFAVFFEIFSVDFVGLFKPSRKEKVFL